MPSRSHRHLPRPDTAEGEGPSGIPPRPEEMSWPDYLVMLLHIAAELEHALMVEYLYAAYSLGGEGTGEHADRMRDWRDTILTVAREEMGHLLTVQNLLLLVGGPVSFERDDYPWSSPFYPFDFRLEPLSLESLACYVYAEMPQELDLPEDIAVRDEVVALVKPGAAPTVGEVYDRIIDLIGEEELIPDDVFEADSYEVQASWDDWGRGYRPPAHKPYAADPDVPPDHGRRTRVIVERAGTRTEALQALREIAGQGEAEHHREGDKTEPSHFDRFARIFREYREILEDDPDWSPSRAMASNPYAGEPAYTPPGSTAIENETSRAWGSLFNIRYRMLLTLLTWIYRIPRDAPDTALIRRAPMLGRIFGEMYNLKAVAGVMVRMPLGDPDAPERAGPPFQMPYTLVPPLPESNYWRMQLDLIDAAGHLTDRLLDEDGPHRANMPQDGVRYLQALRNADRDAREWTEAVLDGLRLRRRVSA